MLISGRGSNLQALIDAIASGQLKAQISCVISDRSDAQGLQRARQAGIPTVTVERESGEDAASFGRRIQAALDAQPVDLVVLAGFMRILDDAVVEAYRGRMINIHPSLLPRFRGIRANEQALAAGVQVHGTSVHFVIPELDAGAVIVQAAVPVLADDDVATLADRVLSREHLILPLAAQWVLSGRCQLRGGVMVLDGQPRAQAPRLQWKQDLDELEF